MDNCLAAIFIIYGRSEFMAELYKTISVRITVEEKEALEQYCAEHDMNMSQLIRQAIRSIITN
jgi:antitoxin component of RelBE/YafQ-DinJ toxin-antitoxin module